MFATPLWTCSATKHVHVSVHEVLFGMQGANALDVVLSCLGWGRILLLQQGAGWGACSNHPRATAGYFICQHIYPYKQGTNGCRGSGHSVTETVGREATYYSIIQPPPGPLPSSPLSSSTPSFASISRSVSFSYKLFQPSMNRNQPCCGPTLAASRANQQGCRTSARSRMHTENSYPSFFAIRLAFSPPEISLYPALLSLSPQDLILLAVFPLFSSIPTDSSLFALILPHSRTNTLEHKHTYIRTDTHTLLPHRCSVS